MKRVVVTGYGIVNALGKNKEEVEKNIFNGVSGVSKKSFSSIDHDYEGTTGEVKNLDEVDSFFEENHIPYDRCAQMALMAARECLQHSQIDYEKEDPYRRGVAIGTSLGGMLSGQTFHRQWLANGLEQADENYLYLYPLHAMADVLAKKFHFKGVKNIISTACAASGNIVGYGLDMIKSGKHDLMLVGGVDPLCVFSFAGFNSLKALDPDPCKPYSTSTGINLGEGGAFVLLEDYEHAKSRGATIYAEILGYGLSADAYHPTAPDLGGGGPSRAMNTALELAGIDKERVSYVNGHGTGTTANDKAERAAFKSVFGDKISDIPLSSIKGAIGHCLGAAGAEECVVSIMALNNGLLPPTVNFHSEKESPINLVPNQAQRQECEVILSNSFAFGGNNCCLAIGKENVKRNPPKIKDEKIVITGMGCCGVGGANIEELFKTFKERTNHFKEYSLEGTTFHQVGEMPEVNWRKTIPPKVIRRIDDVTKLAMTAGKQALMDSKLSVTRNNTERVGIIYATGTGPLATIVKIDQSIVEKGIGSISLSDFPNSVINAAPGNFSIANMLKGPISTLSCGNASFLIAFDYANELLKKGMADAILVISADECNDPLLVGNDKVGLLSKEKFAPLSDHSDGMVLSPGATAVMIETESHALERKARIIASIKGYASTSDNYQIASVDPEGQELYESIKRAVEKTAIDLYINAAMGVENCDQADIHALKKALDTEVFDSNLSCSAVSPMLGVTSGSNSGYGLLNGLYSIINQEVIGLPSDFEVSESISKYYEKENKAKKIQNVCISTMSFGGAYSSLVLEKYNK